MKVTIEGLEIVIRVPLNPSPEPSSTGKSLMLYSSQGFTKPGLVHQGKNVSVSLNVCVPNK